jgi:hypothetical protein
MLLVVAVAKRRRNAKRLDGSMFATAGWCRHEEATHSF